jgi:SRSO17 transposase
MQLPIVSPAPIVIAHTPVFYTLFENENQVAHFQNYLTGLIVLPSKSLSNIARCTLDSADKTNLSRYFSGSPWEHKAIDERRIKYMVAQTERQRLSAKRSFVSIDDTLCEHVGNLFEYVDRHYDHGEGDYPLAHNLVTSHYVSGLVRFPLEFRLYRRYEEATQWEEFVGKHFPDREIPTTKKERQRFHKEVDEELLKDPEFAALYEKFRTKIALAKELVKAAIEQEVPFSVVLMDSWYLCEEIVDYLRESEINWVSLLKKNRNLEVASFTLRDEEGKVIALKGPHIQVQNLVPLIPKSAYRKVEADGKDYYCFAINVRVPGLGSVRLVISYDNAELKGTYAVLLTDRTDWSAKQVIETYVQRWPIETFYQDSKGHLGLDEYRMRTAEAIQKHWCLVFVAYSILHLDCLSASLDKAQSKDNRRDSDRDRNSGRRQGSSSNSSELPRLKKTIGEVCREQSQLLIQALILRAHELLVKGQQVEEVFRKLFAKQAISTKTGYDRPRAIRASG